MILQLKRRAHDIKEIHTEYDESQFESPNEFHNAVVSSVSWIFKYKSCMKCRSKFGLPTTAMADAGPVVRYRN